MQPENGASCTRRSAARFGSLRGCVNEQSDRFQKQEEGFAINEQEDSKATRRKPWISIGVVVSIVIFLGLAFMSMPKSFKMTHGQIGTGKPAVVFVYDPNLQVSISQSEQMNLARDLLGDQVFFLIAKIGTPEGDQLIAKHRAARSELLLFDPSGSLIKRQFALINANELIQWIGVTAP